MSTQLSERYVQDKFHSYLKSSLTQAKVERLLDADVLSSAESDLMITGPALCLYFAALRCTTNPPSVPLPRSSKTESPMELSSDNCPPAFTSFLRVWASTVPSIQGLRPEHQHDLARVICGLPPVSHPSSPTPPAVNGIAADLRAVAIEISQRRSFQDRFASDLQAALDSGTEPGSPSARRAAFVPPPQYEPSPTPSPSSSRISLELEGPSGSGSGSGSRSRTHSHSHSHSYTQSLPSPTLLSPHSPRFPRRSPSPTMLAPHAPAIEFIRETLYASLGDALERTPSLRTLLARDPPRAYFAAVAHAVLDVATTAVTPDGAVVGVLGTPLTLDECPAELRPFMLELAAIGRAAREMEAEDDEVAMRCALEGEEVPLPRMERVKAMLEECAAAEIDAQGRRSVEGRAVAFVNRINALSLGMTRLRAFRERQEEVFKVLAGIGS
ncbi:hypothetical protein H0H81_002821 [Sphagnurus paluster]|uniref:Uncharacterized protein n=1 Tax=Sphagnurus paluster TaxID=117069 RepID=A0A9P7KMW9_9AGAR|nr:hypothetical protein H0H81_002821 [Sphagnurus paluster]